MNSDIPEVRAAEALQRVAALGDRRRALTDELERVTKDLRGACIDAASAGAERTRVRQLGGVSQATLYDWLREAGVGMRSRHLRSKRELDD